MRESATLGAAPLRPMTTGELLDAAMALLGTRARLLIGAGFLFALLEQAVLFPLRWQADMVSAIFPNENRLGWFALLLVVGFMTEALCITALGALSSSAAPRALFGAAAPVRPVPVLAVGVTALVVAVVCGLASVFVLPWPFAFMLLGLVAPALVIDQVGPVRALGRSVRLATYYGMRAGWIRLLGYTSWLFIRFATGFGGWYVLSLVIDTETTRGDNLATGLAWLAVNSVAYPVLGCLDTVLHLETRMRTEGLDISLRRALSRGVSMEVALAVPR